MLGRGSGSGSVSGDSSLATAGEGDADTMVEERRMARHANVWSLEGDGKSMVGWDEGWY
ncbi:hypothetical protein H0H87_003926, partial [Tephrocybe sp. NHM501043]